MAVLASLYAGLGRVAGGGGAAGIDQEGYDFWTNKQASEGLSDAQLATAFKAATNDYYAANPNDAVTQHAQQAQWEQASANGNNAGPNGMDYDTYYWNFGDENDPRSRLYALDHGTASGNAQNTTGTGGTGGTLADAAASGGAYDPGYYGAQNYLSDGLQAAIQALIAGGMSAEQAMAYAQANALGASQAGLGGSLASIAQGKAEAAAALRASEAQARADYEAAIASGNAAIDEGVGAANARLDPYATKGGQAFDLEAAMSGALGPEAQQEAFDNYSESAGQKYLREQQEQALLRNASATGGLQGGNVLTALQEQAKGIAATDQQQYMDNLNRLGLMGQTASTQQGMYDTSGGAAKAQLIANMGGALGQAALGTGGQLANSANNAASQSSGAYQNTAGTDVNTYMNTGQNLSNLYQNIGGTAANLNQNWGNQSSANALNTGVNLANIQTNLGQGIASNFTNLGNNLANYDNNATNNLANTYQGWGGGQADIRTQLATLLGNIATGQGTTQGDLAIQGGNADAAGTLGQSNAWINAISGLAGNAGQYFGQGAAANTSTVNPYNPTGSQYEPGPY